MRRTSWCVIAGLVLGSGCGEEPTRPVTHVALTVTVTPDAGGPSMPISMRALATNLGNTRVLYCSGCGCGYGVGVRVLGPDGSDVALHDPSAPLPDCPDNSNTPLEPGKTLEGGDRFTGVLYRPDSRTYPSPTYAAPPGTYTVIASFGYRVPPGQWVDLTRRTTFIWRP